MGCWRIAALAFVTSVWIIQTDAWPAEDNSTTSSNNINNTTVSVTMDSIYLTSSSHDVNFTDQDGSYNSSNGTQVMTRCLVEYITQKRLSLYSIHGYILPSQEITLKFLMDEDSDNKNRTVCFVTRSDLENKLNSFEGPPIIGAFRFTCKSPIERCRVSLRGAWMVASMTDLRVFTSFGDNSLNLQELQQDTKLCDAFRHVVAFSIINNWAVEDDLHHLATCTGKLDNVVEVVLANVSLKSFPKMLHTVMPNLRALELSNNHLWAPVDFDWMPGFAELPRNLSRTFQFNNLYSYYGAIDIQPNLFRRMYILNGNNITNLTHFYFRGEFQYVSLERNGMTEIGEKVFYRIPDLQFLSLADNVLESLPENLFSSLRKLKRLDLQGNKLKYLPTNLFRNLLQLQQLNLEGNKLDKLQDGLFSNLEHLTSFRLKGNNLMHVSDKAFDTLSIKLSLLDLSENPLKEIPPIIFLLRGLVNTNLESTDIEVLDFVEIINRTSFTRVLESLRNPTSGEYVNIKAAPDLQRVVSLRNSKLRSIVMYNSTEETIKTFFLLAKYFTFQTDGAHLACDCNILNVTHLVTELRQKGDLSGTEALFTGWTCFWPDELRQRTVASLRDEETYCPFREEQNLTEMETRCPDPCNCYIRTGVSTIIVDCQHAGLTSLPAFVPTRTREMWLHNNTIKTVEDLPYLQQLETLKLSANNLQDLPKKVLDQLTSLRVLHVDDNWLTTLLSDLGDLQQLRSVRLSGNPFRCDCNTRWLKRWVLDPKVEVEDWNDIKCSLDDDEGQLITRVPDEKFVCKIALTLTQLAVHIVVPVSLALLLVVLAVIAFLCRRQLKVQLYIYTGLHTFDRDPSDARFLYDVTVCCSLGDQDWVLTNVVTVLEMAYNYKVFFLNRDAFLGYSISNNVRHCVKMSRRLVVVLAKGWDSEETLITAVRQGLDKCRKDMVHFLTVVLHEISPRDIQDKDLQQFVKKGRFLTTCESHFHKKLAYEMPHLQKDKIVLCCRKRRKPEGVVKFHDIVAIAENQENVILEIGAAPSAGCNPRVCKLSSLVANASKVPKEEGIRNEQTTVKGEVKEESMNNSPECAGADDKIDDPEESDCYTTGESVFVWYSNVDLNYTVESIVKPLESRGHQCIVQDRDFPLGAAIQDNIVRAVDSCSRAVFVLSDDISASEWFLFTFHVVFDRCQQHRDRRVLLVLRAALNADNLTDDVQQAVRTSAVLREQDPWFEARLQKFAESDFNEMD
ncbi:hypothetical protein C0Q70_20919 [Pomacea canaliculata]|uniref:TIR domain-containing protein n=1 Tax=Pomacea canaliculata TaxID=400727 RepID=A0A2T7NB15_POMCA|nr:hypothetical protein C0Q70_20919 [Pomacea canaliculata]